MFVHVAQSLEICGEEDIEVPVLNEDGGARDHGILISRLNHGCVVAPDGIRQFREVRKN